MNQQMTKANRQNIISSVDVVFFSVAPEQGAIVSTETIEEEAAFCQRHLEKQFPHSKIYILRFPCQTEVIILNREFADCAADLAQKIDNQMLSAGKRYSKSPAMSISEDEVKFLYGYR